MRPCSIFPATGAALLVLLALVAVGFPAVVVVMDAAAGLLVESNAAGLFPSVGLMRRTLMTAALIAALATVLAILPAWAARAWSAPALLVLLAPMLLPSYLAYSGWGLLRAPGTWLGEILIRGPGGEGVINSWPIAASKVQAILGLTLWAWPVAALVLVARFRGLDQGALDMLRLEPLGPIRRAVAILNMARGGIVAAVGIVALVMLGSAVPLHIAQLETYSMELWRRLSELPHQDHWRIWLAAWPLLCVACIAAIVLVRRLAAGMEPPSRPRGCTAKAPVAFAAVIWSLSVLAPAILFASSLRSKASLVRFWEHSWQPLAASLLIAGLAALLALVLLLTTWYLAAGKAVNPRSARVATLCAGMLLASGLMPGILVGAATARAWSLASGFIPAAGLIAESSLVVVIAHIARFGFVPVLAGLILASAEPRELRSLRLLDTGLGLYGFVAAAVRPQWGVAAAVSLATGLLSLHEIEAAIILQPPSAAGGGLPWRMLQWLHFARMEDLSAAVLWMLGLGAVVLGLAIAAGRLGSRPAQRPRARGQ